MPNLSKEIKYAAENFETAEDLGLANEGDIAAASVKIDVKPTLTVVAGTTGDELSDITGMNAGDLAVDQDAGTLNWYTGAAWEAITST
jgi:hypothetical protein